MFRPHAERLSYQTTAALNSLTGIAGGTASAGNVIHIEVVIPQRTAGSDATRLDTTMPVFTGNAPRASIKTCSIVQDWHSSRPPHCHTTQHSRAPQLPKTDSANGFPEHN